MKHRGHIATIFLLISVIFAQIFQLSLICIDFKINQDYIAQVLCINRERPELRCEGKCHLKLELKKADQQEDSPVQRVVQQTEIHWYYETGLSSDFVEIIPDEHGGILIQPISHLHPRTVYHPPQSKLIVAIS